MYDLILLKIMGHRYVEYIDIKAWVSKPLYTNPKSKHYEMFQKASKTLKNKNNMQAKDGKWTECYCWRYSKAHTIFKNDYQFNKTTHIR